MIPHDEKDNSESSSSVKEDNVEEYDYNWYVLRVQSGKEDRVKKSLKKRIDANETMQNKIRQILVPVERITEIKKGFKREYNRKLYPGYVMIEMLDAEKAQDAHLLVKATPGVGDFAGTMTEDEVERMLMNCGSEKDKAKPRVSFYKDQIVKIKEGAFENYDGIVDEVNEQKGKVKVRIEIFGRFTQVELGFWQVEPT